VKIIYILGLEHSGTTLTDQLLSAADGVVGLGELAGFFSPEHMRNYHEKWGGFPEAYQCSCGEQFATCELWSQLEAHSGLKSNEATPNKYLRLVSVVTKLYGDDVIIVDSSKSITGLTNWLNYTGENGLDAVDIHVILAIKDVRSFAASMVRKANNRYSPLSVVRSFNYWLGGNRQLLNFLSDSGIEYQLSLYESLCADVEKELSRISRGAIDATKLSTNISHKKSHIGIGNKSFILRNRSKIRYDDMWRLNRTIKSTYLLHRRANKLNRGFYGDLDLEVLR